MTQPRAPALKGFRVAGGGGGPQRGGVAGDGKSAATYIEAAMGSLACCGSATPLFIRVLVPATVAALCAGAAAIAIALAPRDTACYAAVLLGTGVGCTFVVAHGVSMVVGRRRPRQFSPRTLVMSKCRKLQGGSESPAVRLRIVRDLSKELDPDTTAEKMDSGCAGLSEVQQYQIPIAGIFPSKKPVAKPELTQIPMLEQFILFFWSAIIFVVVRLPLRSYWDAGGLEEALQRCPTEMFVLPIWLFPQQSARNCLSARRGDLKHRHSVIRVVPSSVLPRGSKAIRRVYVGYRGLVFDDDRIFLDRRTASSSLDELMCWRQDLTYATSAKSRSSGSKPEWVIAESGMHALAFPSDVTRAGRHPRHESSAPTPTQRLKPAASITDRGQSTIHVASLATVLQLHNGYYHWVTERLPALCLLRDTLESHPGTKLLVDLRFHGAKEDNPWCMQFLHLLGIDSSRILRYDPTKVYSCDELFMTSSIPAYVTDPRLLTLVQRCILGEKLVNTNIYASANTGRATTMWNRPCGQELVPTVRVLIVVRRTSNIRRAAIWDGVHDILLREARRRQKRWHVLKIDPASMTVSAQVEAFSDADVVLGVHGAGLANVLWCRPGTCVCEIVPINPPPIRYLFWHLSMCLGLEYHPYHLLTSSWQDSWIRGVDPGTVAAWVISSAIRTRE